LVFPYPTWGAFDKSTSLSAIYGSGTIYSYWSSSATYPTGGAYSGSVVTVDTLGNTYAGEWIQLQNPCSIILSNYVIWTRSDYVHQAPVKFWILGSQDGYTWNLVDSRAGVTWASPWNQTFTVSSAQSYNIYRLVTNITSNTVGTNPVTILEWILNGTIESVNITADGRVGLGVVAPVQALEVAGSGVFAGTVSAGTGLMFRNRIINGDFRFDQRGSASTPAASGYGPDRWFWSSAATGSSIQRYTLTTSTDNIVKQQGFMYGVQVNRGSTGNADLGQVIELGNSYDLFSQPITVSFWGRSSSAGTIQIYIGLSTDGSTSSFYYSAPYLIYLTTTWQYYTATIRTAVVSTSTTNLAQAGVQLQIRTGSAMANGTTQYYTGVQLEKGTTATPFEFRPSVVELGMCQRYYEKSYNVDIAPGTAPSPPGYDGAGIYPSASTVIKRTTFKVPKRSNPSLLTYSASVPAAAGQVSSTSGNMIPAIGDVGHMGFTVRLGATQEIWYHWVAEAEV
jgi:hypothetical protein